MRIFILLTLALFLLTTSVQARPALQNGDGYSLRFYGNGYGDIDRVKIKLDDPPRPIDVGASFTIEWWMKASTQENPTDTCTTGEDNWIYGNILIDRDVYGVGDYGDFGVSLGGGRLMFGVGQGNGGVGICGATVVTDGQWHHIAVTRRQTGQLRIWVDGELDAQMSGPEGDISYRDGRITTYPNDPYLVLGAEKHDAGEAYPSYSGFMDELRISNVIRYSTAFTPPTAPFIPDANTVGLYHMDEGGGDELTDTSGAIGGPSRGQVRYGGDPIGPVWSTDTPFGNTTITATPTRTPTRTMTPTATSSGGPFPTATSTRTPTRTPTGTVPTLTVTSTAFAQTATATRTYTATSLPGTATGTPGLSEALYLPMARRR